MCFRMPMYCLNLPFKMLERWLSSIKVPPESNKLKRKDLDLKEKEIKIKISPRGITIIILRRVRKYSRKNDVYVNQIVLVQHIIIIYYYFKNMILFYDNIKLILIILLYI